MIAKRFKTIGLSAMVVLLSTACSTKELNVSLKKDIVAEYGETLDTSKLYDSGNSDKGIKVDKVENYNSKKLGKQKIKVIFKSGDKSTTKEIEVEVKDTKKPIIELSKKEVTIKKGDKLDYGTIIKKVSDPIDGELKKGKKDEKGYYWIDDSKLNINKIGEYEIKIQAIDKNGLESDETTVKIKVTEEKNSSTNTKEQVDNTNVEYKDSSKSNNSSNSNLNNKNNSNNSGNSSNNEPTPPKQEEPPKTPKPAYGTMIPAYDFPNDFPDDEWSWRHTGFWWEPVNREYMDGVLINVEWQVVPDSGKVSGLESNAIPFMPPKPTLEESKNMNLDDSSLKYGLTYLYVCLEE